jgi:uncharacterized protein YfkK (UPF0435 family)
LPPHFEGPVKITYEDLLPVLILKKASPNLRTTFPFLIATVLYHWDWLKANLPSNHPFFASKIYSSNFRDRCKVKVVTGYFKDEKIGMRATGIPKAVTLMAELAQMKRLMEDQPKMTCDMMLDKINSVNGIQVHNTELLNRTFGAQLEEIKDMVKKNIKLSPESEIGAQRMDIGSYRQFYWDGENHYHPKDFKLPRVHSVTMWRLWLFGDKNNVTAPYRTLRGNFMSCSLRVQLCRARKVMDFIRDKIGLSYEEITNLGVAEAETLFNDAYKDIFGEVKFHMTMNYANAYKHLLKMEGGKKIKK